MPVLPGSIGKRWPTRTKPLARRTPEAYVVVEEPECAIALLTEKGDLCDQANAANARRTGATALR